MYEIEEDKYRVQQWNVTFLSCCNKLNEVGGGFVPVF
jgi:hypothetical protein